MNESSLRWLMCVLAIPAWGQTSADLQAILQRLERLEEQNRQLTEEVRSLRERLAASSPAAPVEERLEVQERRTEELAQTSVQASQKLPVSITGMLLFNAYKNGRYNGAQENPTAASLNPAPRTAGGTFRQTTFGIQFQSPRTVLGANVHGNLLMDFFANTISPANPDRLISNNLGRVLRLRVAAMDLEWGSTTLLVGQEKPIISPREPTSLAQVGVSPLTNAGNPWLWQPQVRLEHRFSLNSSTSIRAQAGVFQTVEAGQNVSEALAATLESSRPGLQGRVAIRYAATDERHLEIASGFHASATHVSGTSVPSRLYTVDWSLMPLSKLTWIGLFYTGQNTSNLGTIRPGFTILSPGVVIPTHSFGGWSQVAYAITPRWTLNVFGGQHDDRNRDLRTGAIGKNFAYAGNALYRIAPNVIVGFELMQIRTDYINTVRRLNNHYDLALAYQF